MSDLTPGPDHLDSTAPTFFEKARKAFSGGIAGGVAAATPTFWQVYPDGFTVEEIGLVAGSFVAGAVVGFIAVYIPRNAK